MAQLGGFVFVLQVIARKPHAAGCVCRPALCLILSFVCLEPVVELGGLGNRLPGTPPDPVLRAVVGLFGVAPGKLRVLFKI